MGAALWGECSGLDGVGAAVAAALRPGTALPSQDRGQGRSRVAQGTQFEGRTSVGCGVQGAAFQR